MKIVGTLNGITECREVQKPNPLKQKGWGSKFILTTFSTKLLVDTKRGVETGNSTTGIEIRVAVQINRLARNGR